MDAPGSLGLGLHVKAPAPLAADAILSTAPASPTEEMPHHKHLTSHPKETPSTVAANTMPPPNSTVASMCFGPATQQTVVTTTTTTTVSLPPLIMNPPRNLMDRDPKQYPLVFSPTPHSIKRFHFDVHGRPTTFHESEDAEETLRQHRKLQAKMQRHNGSLTYEEGREKPYETPTRSAEHLRLHKNVHNIRASDAPKRTATPPSIAEAAELASLQRKIKKPRSQLQRTESETQEVPSLNQRTASGAFPEPSNPSPVTPDTDMGFVEMLPPRATSSRQEGKRRRSPGRIPQSRLRELQDNDEGEMADEEMQEDDSQLGPPFLGKRRISAAARNFAEANTTAGATATPPIAEAELELVAGPSEDTSIRRPNLPNILTSSQQDASLPSPSLSPITAAANLASRQNAFEASFARHNEDVSSLDSSLNLDDDSKTQSAHSFDTSIQAATKRQQSTASSGPTVMDIPTMVDAFDSMPEELQSYVMYQLLRRCPKPTLQMVANVVNPALKCDPFNVLPPELGLNITRYLDSRSMCRAAQVSKRWRRLINSDERAWKNLLERDEFVLPDGEIARAVKEGWGWQHPGEEGYEEDLSHVPGEHDSDDDDTASSAIAKTRRKHSHKYTGQRKAAKRVSRSSGSATKPHRETPAWKKMVALAKGPTALATAAAHAIPHPAIGMDSLRGMHLFKSLYQRHYLIRKAWMMEDSQPQHLAFRAHHRHVVTCLLFDSDKILTGSDDTKINVYDTKSGALRRRLEGHEGGVWALQYEGDTLVSGSTDRSVRVWDIKSGKCLQVFQGHTSTVRCLEILKPVQVDTAADGTPIMMPKEPLIITGSRDSTLRVWKLPQPGDRSIMQAGPPANDRDNPYFIRTLSGHHNSVRAIAAYGDTLVSGSYDCTVRVWKISTGELQHRLQGHAQKVYSVVLDHGRNRCISGSMDNLVKVWDLDTGACLFNLEGHTSLVGLLDLSHDRLVSAAADSTLRIWDPESGACKATLSAHTGAITCFQHDGQKVISGSDRTLKMWNVRNGECVRDLLTDLSGVWQVRFDERRCVAAVQRNNLTYIEVSSIRPFSNSCHTMDVLTNVFTGPRLRRISRRRTRLLPWPAYCCRRTRY
jgi:F-box and WD-40 domain protein CDC4